MSENDLIKVKEFISKNRCMMLKIILVKILKKGGLIEVYKYLNHYEFVNFKEISKEEIYLRLMIIDKDLQRIKEEKDKLENHYKLFTNYNAYEYNKEFMERHLDEHITKENKIINDRFNERQKFDQEIKEFNKSKYERN